MNTLTTYVSESMHYVWYRGSYGSAFYSIDTETWQLFKNGNVGSCLTEASAVIFCETGLLQ